MGRIKRIRGRYYDTGTSNKTFLQVAMDLQRLGIKNYYFMLEIIDYSLVGVNPYDENLSMDMISRIITECTRNPWYYLREVSKIPQTGAPPILFKANRGNIAQIWCCLHGIDSWLCLPRQQGKTESILALLAWVYSFGTNDSKFIFINKSRENSQGNLQRLKDQIECLPKYMQFDSIMEEDEETGKVKVVKAVKNATSMSHPVTKNQISIKASASSYEKALSMARGFSAPVLHYDEPEFTKYIKTILENSVSTYETSARIAKANGAPYFRAFSCTPGDLDTDPGQESSDILQHTCKWTEKMYDMGYDPIDDEKSQLHQYVLTNSTNRIVYIEYNYKQLGLSEAWARKMYDMIDNPTTFKREILLQRLRGSSESPFDRDDLDYVMSVKKAPIDEIFLLDNYRIDVYEPLDKSIPYLVGIDCATGTDGDANAITIINPYTEEPAAEFQCNYIGDVLYEKFIIEMVKKLIPKAIVIIERNHVGQSVIGHLLESPISNRIYFDKNKDLVEEEIKNLTSTESILKKKAQAKRYYGVYTEGNSRDTMISILMNRMANYKDKFVTENIITDIFNLVRFKSGKIAARIGKHDDSIMSYLIAMYVFYHGNNLHAFGFQKGQVYDKELNTGIEHIEDYIISDAIPEARKQIMREQMANQQSYEYEEMLRRAIASSQAESVKLVRKGLSSSELLENTEDGLVSDEFEDDGAFDADLFDVLNGLTGVNNPKRLF